MIVKSLLLLRSLERDDELLLGSLFQAIVESGDAEYFHPHPFTGAHARQVCGHTGKDQYLALISRNEIRCYGLLRGWDEGFDIPSLGIIVHPAFRGRGYSSLMMMYLHAVAAEAGAMKIRLKVYEDNTLAKRLYEKLGYEFVSREKGQLVGYCKIRGHAV
ncbi:GNAT family N-acetyltransferase [bacterium]|nr:GNAT family N-acetyltransferase [bacterium]